MYPSFLGGPLVFNLRLIYNCKTKRNLFRDNTATILVSTKDVDLLIYEHRSSHHLAYQLHCIKQDFHYFFCLNSRYINCNYRIFFWPQQRISFMTVLCQKNPSHVVNYVSTHFRTTLFYLLLSQLGLAIFNKVKVTHDDLLQMLRSKHDPSAS